MFFDISAKSQVNTFSINENYAGLVLASDINRLSCSTDKNSMNDNIFSNNSGNIYNSGSVRNYVDSFKTVIGDFNFSKIIFFKDAIVCCISIPCIQEERRSVHLLLLRFLQAPMHAECFYLVPKTEHSSGSYRFLQYYLPYKTNIAPSHLLISSLLSS